MALWNTKVCLHDGCGRTVKARGLCNKHYTALAARGTLPTVKGKKMRAPTQFASAAQKYAVDVGDFLHRGRKPRTDEEIQHALRVNAPGNHEGDM